MTIRSFVVLILVAGIVGAFIGRAVLDDAPDVQTVPTAFPASSVATLDGQSCKAERAELASTKTLLSICMAFDMQVPEPGPPSVPEPKDPPHLSGDEEIRRNRELLDRYPEAIIFQHADGRTGVYRLDEWPVDDDGIIVARKLRSGDIAWYSGPDAGSRSDPAAFNTVSEPSNSVAPVIERGPDGTIMVNGEPADNAVQRMFGGKVRPEQEEAP